MATAQSAMGIAEINGILYSGHGNGGDDSLLATPMCGPATDTWRTKVSHQAVAGPAPTRPLTRCRLRVTIPLPVRHQRRGAL